MPDLTPLPHRRTTVIGTEEAAAIRQQAAALAALDDITRTSTPGEILYDISCALVDLHGPVKALLAALFEDDPAWAGGTADTLDALCSAAGGLRHAAENV